MSFLKALFQSIYRKYWGFYKAKVKRRRLRKKLVEQKLSTEYPFEIEAKLLRAIDFKDSVMLDIGANLGFYSAALEDIFGPDKIYLFEPLPELYQKLKYRFRESKVFDIALSNTSGRQKISVPIINGRLYKTRATLNNHNEIDQTGSKDIEISLRPLDFLVNDEIEGHIGLIKIDVEGHELQVIEGATDTIKGHQPLLLVEIEARHHSYPIEDIFRQIEGLGYSGFFVDIAEFRIKPVSEFDTHRDQNESAFKSRRFQIYLNNFFFVPHGREAEFVSQIEKVLEQEKDIIPARQA